MKSFVMAVALLIGMAASNALANRVPKTSEARPAGRMLPRGIYQDKIQYNPV